MSLLDLDKAFLYFIKYFSNSYKKFGPGEDDRTNKNVAIHIMTQIQIHLKIVPIEEAFHKYQKVMDEYLKLKELVDKNTNEGIENPELSMNHDNIFLLKNSLLFNVQDNLDNIKEVFRISASLFARNDGDMFELEEVSLDEYASTGRNSCYFYTLEILKNCNKSAN